MAKASTLDELFHGEIKDLYDAEKQLTRALPKMAKAAVSDELKAAFTEHLAQTKAQVTRLEEVFATIGKKPQGKKCAAMAGLVEEGNEMVEETEENSVRDAGLIAAAQKVEHYEIASYGSARTHAEILGNEEAVRLLQETLDEEKDTDEKLTELAQSINVDASDEEDEEEAEEEEAPVAKRAGGRTR